MLASNDFRKSPRRFVRIHLTIAIHEQLVVYYLLGIMRTTFIMFALLLCGCGATHQQANPHAVPQYTFFDEALAKPEYTNAIKQAERDLPDDEWADKPFRQNVSREKREYQVATNISAAIEPKLKQLSVTELVRSLKVESGPTVDVTNFPSGVAENVYLDGFEMIKKEIQSRPKKEMEVLPGLADGRVWLFTGFQGPGETLADFVRMMSLTNHMIPK